MENKIKNWIIDWFEKNSIVNKKEVLNKINENYFQNNWIDSFKFISFIMDIEKKFNISFSNDEFQNRDFSTINGLINIINNKL